MCELPSDAMVRSFEGKGKCYYFSHQMSIIQLLS